MSDIEQRARDLLAGITPGQWMAGLGGEGFMHWVDTKPDLVNISVADHIESLADAEFIAAAPQLVADLADEVERLRAGGPWVEYVERQRAMQRERDGECICDGNPETTNGPEEDCPWHGREYRYWVDGCDRLGRQKAILAEQLQNIARAISLPVGRDHDKAVAELADKLSEVRQIVADDDARGAMPGFITVNKIREALEADHG